MTIQKASRVKSYIDWGAYTLMIGLTVKILTLVESHGQMLAGMEAWIRVAANWTHIPYGH